MHALDNVRVRYGMHPREQVVARGMTEPLEAVHDQIRTGRCESYAGESVSLYEGRK